MDGVSRYLAVLSLWYLKSQSRLDSLPEQNVFNGGAGKSAVFLPAER
jgi:hypothetical protein